MASNIPAALRSGDIGRFAVRAAQIERAKPVIAYWCNFWIVNQIIEKGLHASDDEIKLYTTNLVDKLEQFKTENTDNDAVMDAVAANAYVEQFGLEVFSRADAAMRANKVTRQTADTFQAAATFLELCHIWNPPEPEIAAKIKFAKYHALRIVKAIKAGEDPNASNPVIEEEGEGEELGGTQGDIDVQAQAEPGALPYQPSVEEIPDEADRIERRMAHQSSLDESLHPSRSSTVPPQARSDSFNIPDAPTTAPRPPAQAMDLDTEHDSALNLPSAPATFASSSTSIPNLPDTPANFVAHHSQAAPDAFQSFPPPLNMPPLSPPSTSHDPTSFYNRPNASITTPPWPVQPESGSAPVASRSTHQPVPAQPLAATSTSRQINTQTVDDQAIALAQKHARWAVSALTFDDVDTAIKELRNSLKYLGAN